MSPNMRAYLALGAVFLLGSATGAGAMYAHSRRAQGMFHMRSHSERRVAQLSHELSLSAEQSAKVTAIYDRHRDERGKLMRETMDRCGEPLRKLRASNDAEIRELLSPEQQKRFDELNRNRDRRGSLPQPSSP